MPFPAVAVGAALAAGAVLKDAVFGVPGHPNPDRPGQLYRLTVRVPPAVTDGWRREVGSQKAMLSKVGSVIAGMGYDAPLLVTQDPSEKMYFTVLARRNSAGRVTSRSLNPAGTVELRIQGTEPVEEPPKVSDEEETAAPFDPGLTPQEAWTVKTAYLYNQNPRHLTGLAGALEPWFPVSASLLRAKAQLMEERIPMDAYHALQFLQEALRPRLVPVARFPQALAAFQAFAGAGSVPRQLCRDELKRAVCDLIQEPRNSLQGYPLEIANLARLLVVFTPLHPAGRGAWEARHNLGGLGDSTPGVWVVDQAKMQQALPFEEGDAYVNSGALQTVLGLQKPEWSKISDKEKLQEIFEAIAPGSGAPGDDVMLTRNQLERALRAIERQRWVNWYQRSK